MAFRPDRPHNDLPPLPPKADIETRPLLKACIETRAALAELKTAGNLGPNQAVLINSIPLLEAQASSEIENIVTTTDRLFRFAGRHEAQADPATKEALRHRTALHQGVEDLANRPLSTRTAVKVCWTIDTSAGQVDGVDMRTFGADHSMVRPAVVFFSLS